MHLIESLMQMAQAQPPMKNMHVCFTDEDRWRKCTELAEKWWDDALIKGSAITTGGVDMEFSIEFPHTRSKIFFQYCRSWRYVGDVFTASIGRNLGRPVAIIDDDSVDIIVDTDMSDTDRKLMHIKGILDIEPVVVNLSDGMVSMLANI